eukprot:4976808-Ditylum_brightwellii.AAC.1
MFGGAVHTHYKERCNKKAFIINLLEGNKKQKNKSSQSREFCAMLKAFEKLDVKKRVRKRSHNDSDSWSSSSSDK